MMEGIEDDFSRLSEAFIVWLKNSNAEISDKIALRDLRDAGEGRGVVATAPISEDELLFSIPRSSVLSVENSTLSKKLPASVFAELDPWLSLIITMVFEYLQGPRSTWRPYFDVLPSSFNTLMFWSEDELSEPQASAVRGKIGREGADASFKENVIPVIHKHEQVFFGSGEDKLGDGELLALAHRMGSIIMAYAFDIEPVGSNKEVDEEGYASDEEDEALPKGMVPLADILNADADRNNARLFYETSTLTMKALKPIATGDQLFNDYGPLPRSDLLRRYGYTTDNYAKYDVAELPFELIQDVLTTSGKIPSSSINERSEYLDEHGILDTGYDIAVPDDDSPLDNISPELVATLETFLLPAPEFSRLKSKGKLPKGDKFSARSARIIHEIVQKRIAQYATTLDQEFTQPMPQEKRRRMAKEVRMGEKMILRETEKVLAGLVEELGDAGVPPTTRGASRAAEENLENGSSKRRRVA